MLVLAAISSSASRCSLRKKYQNYKNMFIFAVTPSLSGVGGCGERGGDCSESPYIFCYKIVPRYMGYLLSRLVG